MESPFVYYRYVTGKNFLGRKDDCRILGNLLLQGEHVAIYESPKSGKMSLIQQTLLNIRVTGMQFVVGQFNLLNVRTIASFLQRYGSTAIRTVASTPEEYVSIVAEYLKDTHFVFDQDRYSADDEILSLNWDIDDNDIAAILRLPFLLSSDRNVKIIMIIDEFQNVEYTEDGERILKAMEKLFSEMRSAGKTDCVFLLCGSMVNAMKHIFEEKHYFYRQVEHLSLRKIDEREIIEYIHRGFMLSGKEIDRSLLHGTCQLFRCNMWYINHFISICDSLSKGYIVESTLIEALNIILSIHEPRFMAMMAGLTSFQVNMLRAIVDGNVRFSAADVIRNYGLNSSANVKRVREALVKKEIVTFNDKEEPLIMDPLFEYWVTKYYFEK